MRQVLELGASPNSEQLVFLHVASIAMSLQTGGPTGFMMSQTTRRLEIGGIVYDWGLEHRGYIDGTLALAEDGQLFTHHSLVVDKLYTDLAGGGLLFPNAVQTWSPWKVQFPTQTLNLAGGTPDDTTQEGDMPLRTLFQRYQSRNLFGRRIVGDSEGVLYVPDDQLLAPRQSGVNRRLRLVLDDNQGLFLVFALRAGPNWTGPDSREFECWTTGKLYWRYKQ